MKGTMMSNLDYVLLAILVLAVIPVYLKFRQSENEASTTSEKEATTSNDMTLF
jgi:hypothetical protein